MAVAAERVLPAQIWMLANAKIAYLLACPIIGYEPTDAPTG